MVVTRSADGVVGVINHSSANTGGPAPRWVSALGTEGRISFEMYESWLKLETPTSQRTLTCPGDPLGLVTMVREFRNSIREGREPEMSGLAGLDDLKVVLKAYESMEAGASLPLNYQS